LSLVGVGVPAIGLFGGEGAKYINGVGVVKAEPVFPYQAGIQEFHGIDKLCTCNYIMFLLAHLSTKCSVSFCDPSMSGVRRPSSVRPSVRASVNNFFKQHLL